MKRAVHQVWASRLAVFAVLAALLVQSVMAAPLGLRMASDPVCSASHPAGGSGQPGLPMHDHEHCLLCQASAAPPLLQTPPSLPVLTSSVFVPAVPSGAPIRLARPTAAFLSRGPPTLLA